jgi:hypothetical protein
MRERGRLETRRVEQAGRFGGWRQQATPVAPQPAGRETVAEPAFVPNGDALLMRLEFGP